MSSRSIPARKFYVDGEPSRQPSSTGNGHEATPVHHEERGRDAADRFSPSDDMTFVSDGDALSWP